VGVVVANQRILIIFFFYLATNSEKFGMVFLAGLVLPQFTLLVFYITYFNLEI